MCSIPPSPLQSDLYIVGACLQALGLGLQYFFDTESLPWSL